MVCKLLLAMTVFLEIFSVACVQSSSARKPQYALFGMLLAFLATVTFVSALICQGRMERVEFRRRWFYYPRPSHRPFITYMDACAVLSCICMFICPMVHYVCYIRHVVNPIKPSLYSGIIMIYLYASRAYKMRKEMRAARNTRIQNIEDPEEMNKLWVATRMCLFVVMFLFV